MIFRKGKKSKSSRRHAADPYAEAPQPEQPAESRLADRPGPYDADDVDTDSSRTGRFDFGSLQVRAMPGTQLLVHWEREIPRAVLVRDQQSVLDLRAFAAPRTEGLWDELRQEMAADATKGGGMVSEHRGQYGVELEVAVPAQTQDGRHGTRTSRLIGIDGPRWFLRVQIWGPAAKDAEAARPFFATLADMVVVRGDSPMAPRDFLPLSLPEGMTPPTEQDGQQQSQPQQGQLQQGQPQPQQGQPQPQQQQGQPRPTQRGQPTTPFHPGQPGQGQPRQPGQPGRTQQR